MSFDVPKLVRSPGCDHGHDEESRNGPDTKKDILEGYVWTSEWFRMSSGIYRSTRGLPEPPGGVNGPHGPKVEKSSQGRPHAPSPPSPNWTRREGRRPLFLLSFPLSYLDKEREGSPTPGRSRTPPAPLSLGRRPLPPWLLYILRQGAPLDTQVDPRDHILSRVRCPPPP